MASLLVDPPEKEEVTRRNSASLGAEIAMEILHAKEHSFHRNGFRKGAEAVASLLSDPWWSSGMNTKDKMVESFIQGGDIIIESIPDARKERGPVS